MIALSITMVIMSIPGGQPQDAGSSIYLADKILEGLGFEKHPGKDAKSVLVNGSPSMQAKSSTGTAVPCLSTVTRL